MTIPIQKVQPGVLRYTGLHFNSQSDIQHQVHQDLNKSGFTVQDIRDHRMILDFSCEGHCDQVAAPLIKYLQSLPVQDLLVIYSTCVDTKQLDYRALSMPNWMVTHSQWLSRLESMHYDDTVDQKFLCLMRRPSHSRAMIARMLLDSNCDVRMSFGSAAIWANEPFQHLFPDVNLPMLIDGVIDRVTNDTEHDQTNPVFHSCLFNLVVESSSQTDVGIWRSLFITEKTFKSFGLRQIPIWFAVPGLVQEIRKLGFDMFDDIVNHDYDSIPEEETRFRAVIDQVRKLDQTLSISQCQDIRKSLRDRLCANFDLLQQHRNRVREIHYNTVKEFVK